MAVCKMDGICLDSFPITLYNCQQYPSCSQCTTSPFSCHWSIADNRCTQYSNTGSCTDNVIAATGSSSNCFKGPTFCPRIASGQQKILVPYGQSVSVSIELENINPFLGQQNFQCLEFTGLFINQSYSLIKNNTVLCCEMAYKWKEDELVEPKNFNMSIAWGENNVIAQSIDISVYHCPLMANNCVNCQFLHQQFPCFWSAASSSCLDDSVCGMDSGCLSRNATCPEATIEKFDPLSASLFQQYLIIIDNIEFNIFGKCQAAISRQFVYIPDLAKYMNISRIDTTFILLIKILSRSGGSEEALEVIQSDRNINQEFDNISRLLVLKMMEDPRQIKDALRISWCARALERIGDHTKNICEYIVYLVKGKDVRHTNLDKIKKEMDI